jgi:hypothetical protein
MLPVDQAIDAHKAINRMWQALPDLEKYTEGEVLFPMETVRNVLILARNHVFECQRQWGAQNE